MQSSVISSNSDGNQVIVNVTTSETRVKDFTFGESNQHHILQYDGEKNLQNALVVNDGLGVTDTDVTVTNNIVEAKMVLATNGDITIYVDAVQIYP